MTDRQRTKQKVMKPYFPYLSQVYQSWLWTENTINLRLYCVYQPYCIHTKLYHFNFLFRALYIEMALLSSTNLYPLLLISAGVHGPKNTQSVSMVLGWTSSPDLGKSQYPQEQCRNLNSAAWTASSSENPLSKRPQYRLSGQYMQQYFPLLLSSWRLS